MTSKDQKALKLFKKQVGIYKRNPYYPIYLSTSYLKWLVDKINTLSTKDFIVSFPNLELQISTDGVTLKKNLTELFTTRLLTDNGLVIPFGGIGNHFVGTSDYDWLARELKKKEELERKKRTPKPIIDVTNPTPISTPKVAKRKPISVLKPKNK
jgi:hypothetical protein